MRCKACDKVMRENEIKWREDIKQHEELCLKCRQAVYNITEEDLAVIDQLEEKGL